jgi:excinuclease ABC subunit A
MEAEVISIRGAREHNLAGIDVEIPKKKLVVFTGVSGSGKSSLAFDTLYAEGQRRYVESLSAYARQFLGQMEKPHYDSIQGLSPTIAIEQKAASANPRSTVGTVTEIYDYLRVLFARAGVLHCPSCGRAVGRQSAEQMVRTMLAWPAGTRLLLMAPLARNRKGEFKHVLDKARAQGFVRARIDGQLCELSETPDLDKQKKHDLDLVIDRLVVQDGIAPRLTDSVETCLREGDGRLIAWRVDTSEELLLSEQCYCPTCDRSFPELSPQLFSFNSPLGMCPTCQGLGTSLDIDLGQVVPDDRRSIREGAVRPWARAMADDDAFAWTREVVVAVTEHFHIDREIPWRELSPDHRQLLLYGAPAPIEVAYQRNGKKGVAMLEFEGAVRRLQRRWRETKSAEVRAAYQEYFSEARCALCEGTRLRPEARATRVGGRGISELCGLPIAELRRALTTLELTGTEADVAGELLREIQARTAFLDRVGLGYLSLGRTASTLSGGENQRIRLASQIGSELTGVIYILDEPSIGLHPKDNARLIEALSRLRDIGNSVIVVEHDQEMMQAADWILDFGPGAGRNGGRVVAAGTASSLSLHPDSLTGAFLSGRRAIPTPPRRRPPKGFLRVVGARENNLKDIDVDFPLGVFTVVTGVSGAGKSSLVSHILVPALQQRLHGTSDRPGAHGHLEGVEAIGKVIHIDQRPIGRTPRSNPATYTKAFDQIREIFASTREAQAFGYKPARFSFNVKGGRCETCQGAGEVKVEMHFLADVWVRCEECGGRRFNEATLRVHYKGLDIAELLEVTVDEAWSFFEHHPRLRRLLQTLIDVGLGYVALGQSSTTLSGGEAQRVKLSRELARVDTGRTLYFLDEPSTGLHPADVERLLQVTGRLVDAGNTVVMIEHHLDIIRTADHVVDLGPEGGDAGGYLIAQGTPEEIARVPSSHTGRFLSRALGPDRPAIAVPKGEA